MATSSSPSKSKTYVGYKPFNYQKAVIKELTDARGTGKVVVCKSQRQRGKSLTVSNILLYYAINYRKSKNFYISPTLKQAKAVYKMIIDAVEGTGVIKSSNATDLVIILVNGSEINFKSAEMREALRGYTCTGILCIDEAAYIPDDIFNIISPWRDFHHAVTLMTSTPFIKAGFFWKHFNYGLEKSNNTVTVDWASKEFEEEMRMIMSPEKLEEYRQTLPKNVFLTEYMGEWLSDDGIVFNNYMSCIHHNEIKPTDILYWGIDWSNQSGNDDTVLTAFNQYGQQVYLKYWNDLTPLKQIDVVYKELEPYLKQTRKIQPELNSIGDSYTELLKERLQISDRNKVEGFVTSNPSKNDIVTQMQIALEGNKVELMDDEKLIRQFSIFTATYNPKTKNVSYAAPEGLHDDIPLATMFAYDAYLKNKTLRTCISVV